MNQKRPIPVGLDEETIEALERIAAREKRTRASLMRLFIERAIEADQTQIKAESEPAPTAA